MCENCKIKQLILKANNIVFNIPIYESLIDNNVWSPAVYPAGWQLD